jgi:membrane glycosyltransferase
MDKKLMMTPAVKLASQIGDFVPVEQHHCDMPEQVLWPGRTTRQRLATRVRSARLALVVLWLLVTASFAWTLYRVLSVDSPTALQLVFLVLSTLCFAWVAIGSASALLGYLGLLTMRKADTLELPPHPALPQGRTALLFPVYREDAATVAATIDVMCQEIAAAKAATQFDVFILSDTQDAAERLSEYRIYSHLRAHAGPKFMPAGARLMRARRRGISGTGLRDSAPAIPIS